MNIAVLGNTGAGKTTFIEQMMKRFNKDYDKIVFGQKYGTIKDTYKPDLLEDFYHNPYHNSFKMELDKLLQAISDIALIYHGRDEENTLLDRSFLDIHVFTEALHNMGMLGKPEWNENNYPILRTYLDATFQLFLKDIDLVVFLRADFDILLKNITKRGRSQEVSNVYNDDLYGLGVQLNLEADKLIEKLKEKNIKVVTFHSLSQYKIDSDEYIKALELVNGIVDYM